jgi:glycosyltransferase involved in cell wall biosynthesis
MVFYGNGALQKELDHSGIKVIDLKKRGRWDIFSFLWRLVTSVRAIRPTVVYSFLTMANLLTAVCKPLLGAPKLVWGLRASNMDMSRYDWLWRATSWLEGKLSRLPSLCITNSFAGKKAALQSGFNGQSIQVVPNGIDTLRFDIDQDSGLMLRHTLRIKSHEILIGLVGRLDPMKGHAIFIKTAGLLLAARPDLKFICVGQGKPEFRAGLLASACQQGLTDAMIWLDHQADMPALYNALDLLVSASLYGEGVSNAICEAMASGTPCVVTAVGDSALIVGDTGAVVPPGDPAALAKGIMQQLRRLQIERVTLARAARDRIQTNYSLNALVTNTLAAFENIR